MLASRLQKVSLGLVAWCVCLAPLPAASAPLVDRFAPVGATKDLISQLDRPIDDSAQHQHVDPAAALVVATGNEPTYWYPANSGPVGPQGWPQAGHDYVAHHHEAPNRNAFAANLPYPPNNWPVGPQGWPYAGHVYVAPHQAPNRAVFPAADPSSNMRQRVHRARMPPQSVHEGTFYATNPYVLESGHGVPSSSTRPAVADHAVHHPATSLVPVQRDSEPVTKAAAALLRSLKEDSDDRVELVPIRTYTRPSTLNKGTPSANFSAKKLFHFYASDTTRELVRAFLQALYVEKRRGLHLPPNDLEVVLMKAHEANVHNDILTQRYRHQRDQAERADRKTREQKLSEWEWFEVGDFVIVLTHSTELVRSEGYTLYSVIAGPSGSRASKRDFAVGVYAIPWLT